jgi:protein disulfide-isomerase A6
MKPAWDELGTEYSDSSSVLVGDVDCTAEGNAEFCEKVGVEGYPTVKFFTADTGDEGKDYDGERGLDELKAFVAENLSAKCLIEDQSECSDKEVGFIAKMQAKGGKDAAAAELARLQKMVGTSMKPELKKWISQRMGILKQLAA